MESLRIGRQSRGGMLAKLIRDIRRGFAKSLRFRVLALTLGAFVVVAIPACLSFIWIVDTTVMKLGTLFAEKQILYDRHRGLETLTREVALAETLARAPNILDWAADESDPEKRRRGLDELEHFRLAFRDQSYFFVIGASGNYYYNDRLGSFTGDQLRYTISPDNPRDGWYYKIAAMGPGCELNVDKDDTLQVTNVWINCVVTDGGKVLGIVGTGIDLTEFLRTVVNSDQTGVESMFVDRSGAVQANRDASRIDFHSLTKDSLNKKTIFQMLDDERGRAAFTEMMVEVREGRQQVAAGFLRVNGYWTLVGVGYLDRLGWFNVTLMDVDEIIDRRIFLPIAGLLAVMMIAAAALVTLLFKRSVLDRIAKAEASILRVEAGDFSAAATEIMPAGPVDDLDDEIGRLARALNRMAAAVRDNTATLETAVRERTRQLERIASVDALTGALNRRGFKQAFLAERAKGAGGLALMVLDLDSFKEINDSRGHQAGDEVIAEIARRISGSLREGDVCARWGGDEFVVLAAGCDAQAALSAGRGILDEICNRPVSLSDGSKLRISTSIGIHLLDVEDSLDTAAAKADTALYAAKNAGRNSVSLYDPGVHHNAAHIFRIA